MEIDKDYKLYNNSNPMPEERSLLEIMVQVSKELGPVDVKGYMEREFARQRREYEIEHRGYKPLSLPERPRVSFDGVDDPVYIK